MIEIAACESHEHRNEPIIPMVFSALALEKAARLFRALGDESRLSLLVRLSNREACVTEIAESFGEGASTISQRLRLLRSEGLVKRRRDGKHLYYSLVDEHIHNLLANAIDHSQENKGAKL
ncbi:MAG: metalloregulator ArsR/SmtB family transcription factor [Leptospiraceae bacterium]|jgi:ArsR family transcriptional regulator|nr:metalloregulator ArsR/SmtB family transcription factor [Leptospiraceae bacterium]MCZ8347010.1 metalloregulator ArsR/SmtB family transcription factor [Leptospiraceae bacterium]